MSEDVDWRKANLLDVGKLCTVWDLRQNPSRHVYRFGLLTKIEDPGMAIVLLQWGPDEERDSKAIEVPSSAVYLPVEKTRARIISETLYRSVDSRDTYTVVEFSNDEVTWEKATLDHIAVFSNRSIIYTGWTDTAYKLWTHARCKIDNNLAGWMPDDWRVLYDTEIIDSEDWFVHHDSWKHGGFLNLIYSTSCRDYAGKTAKQAILEKPWFYAVVRPKFISATSKDVGKSVLYSSPKVLGKLTAFVGSSGCRPECVFDEANGKRHLVHLHELQAINPAFQRNEAKKIHD